MEDLTVNRKTIDDYELPISALAAASTFMAKDDVRHYLNGVYLDFPAGRIVSTTGHCLFVGAIPAAACEPVIVPRDMVEQAIKARKGRDKLAGCLAVSVTLDRNDGDCRRVEFNHVLAGAVFRDNAIDGSYPAYEHLIPRTYDGSCGNYNPQYLADANRALALYEGTDPARSFAKVHQQGPQNAALITGLGTALCVVMPVRADDGEPDLAWFHGKPAPAKADT
jgi:hypothetical protein